MFHSLRSGLAMALVLIVGIVMVCIGFQESANAKKLAKDGVSVPATAINHEITSGRRGSKTYKITATYQPKEAGRPLQTKTFRVTRDAYEGSENGQPLNVRYLPSDPSISLITGDTGDGAGNLFAGGLMSVIGAGGLGWRVIRGRNG
jgi:hypothetical protein